MPRYEYRCRVCDSAFDVTRPMAEAGDPASCPSGHTDTVKLVSQVAMVSRAVSAASSVPASSDGCCGGGCVCAR